MSRNKFQHLEEAHRATYTFDIVRQTVTSYCARKKWVKSSLLSHWPQSKNLLSTMPASHKDQNISFRSITPNVIFNWESFFVLGYFICKSFVVEDLLGTTHVTQLFKDHTLKLEQQELHPLPVLASWITRKVLPITVSSIPLLLRKENPWHSFFF